jgi:hypothetical protein|nr:MAG TPA: hypothetical protein [Caudoviricetes sp.]
MITPLSTLKRWFSNFMKPNQEHFWAIFDSFRHKSEKVPMEDIDGLTTALEGTASAEQLQNHLRDSHAHSELLDKKVDKVPGKMLSTNDFTNGLRTKLEGLWNVDISGLLPKGGYTGTAQNLKELIDNIMRILQSPDTELDELREIVAYIKQNKRILETLGISNIAGLQDALNGKAPTDHNHDDRYSRLGHTHAEYAYRTHRHRWDDIDGKPSLDFIPNNWNKRNNKEVIRTQVDEWLRINELNSHTNGVYFGTSVIRTDGQVQVGEGGAEAILSNLGLILKKRLRINAWSGGDGADIKCKGNLQIGSTSGIVEFRKIFGDLVNWNGNTTITVDINDGLIKLNGIKTNVNPSGERVFTTNGQTIHLAEYIGTSGSITSNWTMGDAWYGRTVNVMANAVVNVSTMAENRNVVFRKCFAGGAVTFNTTGKQVVYTGDNAFNGGDGSTAVVSTAGGNKMYIDIRNV